jgi:hypothetical protein
VVLERVARGCPAREGDAGSIARDSLLAIHEVGVDRIYGKRGDEVRESGQRSGDDHLHQATARFTDVDGRFLLGDVNNKLDKEQQYIQ